MKSTRRSKVASKKGGRQARNPVLIPTVTSASPEVGEKPKGKRGVRTPSDELDRLIKMANLAGRAEMSYQLMDFLDWRKHPTLLLDTVMGLPDPTRTHLLELMNRAERWRVTPRQLIDELGFDPEMARRECQFMAVRERYNLIRGANTVMKSIVRGETHFPAPVFILRDVDHKANYAADEITQPLIGVDLRDIRECAVCAQFFFARRITSAVCEPGSTCAVTYSKRQERANAKQQAELEDKKKSREKKRAKPAPKR